MFSSGEIESKTSLNICPLVKSCSNSLSILLTSEILSETFEQWCLLVNPTRNSCSILLTGEILPGTGDIYCLLWELLPEPAERILPAGEILPVTEEYCLQVKSYLNLLKNIGWNPARKRSSNLLTGEILLGTAEACCPPDEVLGAAVLPAGEILLETAEVFCLVVKSCLLMKSYPD